MRNSPSCNCCTAGPSDCCTGTKPTFITISITDIPGPCDFWNGTWILGHSGGSTCTWVRNDVVDGVGAVLIVLWFYLDGTDLHMRVTGEVVGDIYDWCGDIITSTACCSLVGTVVELLADGCGVDQNCLVVSASEVEITAVTGC